MPDNTETNCSMCARHGITRNNCTTDQIMCDLETLVNNGNMNIAEIENKMNNIIEHTNMTDEAVVALFAYFVANKKNNKIQNCNKDIQIRLLEIENVKEICSTTFCGICLEDVKSVETSFFNCKHSFCGDCVIKTLVHSKNKSQLNCYVCRTKVNIINIYDDKNIYNGLKQQLSL